MSVVIVCQGRVTLSTLGVDRKDPDLGKFLKRFDPDYKKGLGRAWWTSDRAEAVTFPSVTAALDEWKRPSSIQPIHLDGRPNRPLTAYSISFEIFE